MVRKIRSTVNSYENSLLHNHILVELIFQDDFAIFIIKYQRWTVRIFSKISPAVNHSGA
ncbi:hypothetical protein RUMOBE_03422 [Blautia obeum ATCC 29174]|uniref:Uncharacterized protein n=1 Tax=Blautia obeum ATCC 29174 TaxID=411459 RepID=A5ZWM8_9FIRM|nr:hypothetical protein RUMOBE_03422 [Blautia obeum ATCC 29174]